MKYFAFLLSLLVSDFLFAAEPVDLAKSLPRSNPESQGTSSSKILEFIDAADRNVASMHSFMLVRHGQVVTEGWWGPYNSNTRHELYSLSKSFTSAAAGLVIEEGKLRLDDVVMQFFPDDVPTDASDLLKSMRVSDLLTMSTGHVSEAKVGIKEAWTKTFLSHPVSKTPGSHFLYNTPSTYMISAIIQKQTGMTTLDYLKPRLFDPLGIEGPTWGLSPQGVSLGGYGLNLRTEDIAKFGQLLLQKGKWNGQQLIPEAWVTAATSNQISTGRDNNGDWGQGYGYQFWQCRNNCFRGDGAFGQYCIVMPEQDAVIAITSGTKDMQSVLNHVWDRLLPAFQPAALSIDATAEAKLKDRLASLLIPTPTGSASSSMMDKLVGTRFDFEKNTQELEQVSFEKSKSGGVKLMMTYGGVAQPLECGFNEWKSGKLKMGLSSLTPEHQVAACGAWSSDSEYNVKLCLVETPFVLSLKLQFKGDELLFDSESNVGFAQSNKPQLVGRVSASTK
jgi:CubicO group peptidase (beta-lactamase class C family)